MCDAAQGFCPPAIDPQTVRDGLTLYFEWLFAEYSGVHQQASPDTLLAVQDMLGQYSAWLLGDRERLQDILLDCWWRECQAGK